MKSAWAATLATLVLGASAAWGQSAVVVTNAWSRATPPGAQTGAAYFTLTSPAGDKLVGVSTQVAKTAQVHEMTMDGTIMRMREVTGGLDLPPGKPVALQPGGYHVMLMGLAAPLKRGQTLRLHLTFEHAAPVDVEAPIAAIGATSSPMGGPGGPMHMP